MANRNSIKVSDGTRKNVDKHRIHTRYLGGAIGLVHAVFKFQVCARQKAELSLPWQ